jgi:hypothetical protein
MGTVTASVVCGTAFGACAAAVTSVPGTVPVVLALVLGVGWSWAALAAVAGARSRSMPRAALGGMLALIGAVVAYYAVQVARGDFDHVNEAAVTAVVTDWQGMLTTTAVWAIAAVMTGPILGVTGRRARGSGMVGLGCRLVIPVIALLEMRFRIRGEQLAQPRAVAVHTWRGVEVAATVLMVFLVVTYAVRRTRSEPRTDAAGGPGLEDMGSGDDLAQR